MIKEVDYQHEKALCIKKEWGRSEKIREKVLAYKAKPPTCIILPSYTKVRAKETYEKG